MSRRQALLDRLSGRSTGDALAGNLGRMLDAHAGCAPAQPWLGISAAPEGAATSELIRTAIATALGSGEPRLAQAQVEIVPDADGSVHATVTGRSDAGMVVLRARRRPGSVTWEVHA